MKISNAKSVTSPQKQKPGKASGIKRADAPPGPVFMKAVRVRPGSQPSAPATKPKKRENTFSKSRDTREDRGARQMKTSRNPQTQSHGH